MEEEQTEKTKFESRHLKEGQEGGREHVPSPERNQEAF